MPNECTSYLCLPQSAILLLSQMVTPSHTIYMASSAGNWIVDILHKRPIDHKVLRAPAGLDKKNKIQTSIEIPSPRSQWVPPPEGKLCASRQNSSAKKKPARIFWFSKVQLQCESTVMASCLSLLATIRVRNPSYQWGRGLFDKPCRLAS